MRRLVTVDGPAGSGKSTLGHRLASSLHLPLVDTGLFYRGLTVAAVRHGLRDAEPQAWIDLAAATSIEINTVADDRSWQVRVDGEDAGEMLRDPRHAILLSSISRVPQVRRLLLQRQRDSGAAGAVAVGRDCGTVIFPDAPVKFYLQAPQRVRVGRRAAQIAVEGGAVDPGVLTAEVAGRDALDSASLAPADDAVIIDTGELGVDAMVDHALRVCAQRGIR